MKIFIAVIVFSISFSACDTEASNGVTIDSLVQTAKYNGNLSQINRIGGEVKSRFNENHLRFSLCLSVANKCIPQDISLAKQMRDSADHYLAAMEEDQEILNIILK